MICGSHQKSSRTLFYPFLSEPRAQDEFSTRDEIVRQPSNHPRNLNADVELRIERVHVVSDVV